MFVLSIVLPPEEGAAFGESMVFDPVHQLGLVPVAGSAFLFRRPEIIDRESARMALAMVTHAPLTTEVMHKGVTFRIDPAEYPPNVCPCCGRLVKPDDHAFAGTPDAYCLGCFTWKRGVDACLPENSAHTEEI